MKEIKYVYLSGPMAGCTDSEAKDWRDEASRLFYCALEEFPKPVGENLIIRTLDPTRHDYRNKDCSQLAVAKTIVEDDKIDIERSAAVLVYPHKISVGTSMEILYAWERGKYVVTVDEGHYPLSPWTIYHSNKLVTTLDYAVESIIRHLGDHYLCE